MSKKVNRRQYRSPKREEQALATRQAILDAAHRLFVAKGYIATSIREIASEARVAEPTVYAAFGDKSSILWAVLERLLTDDGEAVPLAQSEFVQAMRAEPDPHERLRVAVYWGTGELFDRGIAEILDTVFQAAAVDAGFQELVRGMLQRRHEDSLMLADVISGGGAHLRPDVAAEDVADLMEAIVSVPFYRTLVNDRGWSREKYQQWALRIAEWLFFADAGETPNSEE